jgi:hypothetical protein
LVALADSLDLDLWHDKDGTAFATVGVRGHQEHWRLRSRALKSYLQRAFYESEGTSANGEAISSALGVLEGKALHDGEAHVAHVRVGTVVDGLLYLDLTNDEWSAVEIDATGWRVVESASCPARFVRSPGIRPLPRPERGGSLEELRPFLNLASNDDFILITSWLVGAFRAAGPYPLLNLHGEQGTGKTEQARLLRALVDPNAAPVRAEPRDARDLMIAARNARVIALDNLSHLQPWLSDALCRLSTGGGFTTRALYTDSEEALFDSQRPVILTGINEVATRGDLLDRSVLVTLPRISDTRRRSESSLWREFDAARPRILGSLLDAVAAAIRNELHVELERLPRMADFAIWISAAEEKMPWPAGSFMAAYNGNRALANETALEASPVAAEVLRLMAKCETWQGTAGELLARLEKDSNSEKVVKAQSWPKSPRSLSSVLRRIAPNLRTAGVAIEFNDRARPKSIRISKEFCDGSDACDGDSLRTHESAPEAETPSQRPSLDGDSEFCDGTRKPNEIAAPVAPDATVATSRGLEDLF